MRTMLLLLLRRLRPLLRQRHFFAAGFAGDHISKLILKTKIGHAESTSSYAGDLCRL